MDKQEAERLVRAIERAHVAWLQVDQIVFSPTGNAYELECSYRGTCWMARSQGDLENTADHQSTRMD